MDDSTDHPAPEESGARPRVRGLSRKAAIFWPLLVAVLLADCTTKRIAVESLDPPGVPHEVLGEVVRLTLHFNTGAAMGLPLGPYAMEILGALGFIVSIAFFVWYRRTPPDHRAFGAAIALLISGALGNAWERLFSARGVVDFIDVGVGAYRFWTFNVADVAITSGAILLILLAILEERRHPGGADREAASSGAAGPG